LEGEALVVAARTRVSFPDCGQAAGAGVMSTAAERQVRRYLRKRFILTSSIVGANDQDFLACRSARATCFTNIGNHTARQGPSRPKVHQSLTTNTLPIDHLKTAKHLPAPDSLPPDFHDRIPSKPDSPKCIA
jgi:hypothetical protein